MSAIEEACWDIFGKSVGLPAYALLGGQCRERLRVYANGWYRSARQDSRPEAFARDAEAVVKLGYTAMKFDPFMEVMMMDQGIPGKVLDKDHEDRAIARVRAVRDAIGPDVDILIEVHGWLGPMSAIRIGKRLEEFRPFFYEEPVDPSNVEAMLRVKEHVNIPVASGERIYTRYGFRPFLEKQALDIIQPDINIDGGILETKKIAAAADTYHIPVAPHNCWGPVGTAAAVHFDSSTPNFLIQEWFAWETDLHFAIVDEPFEKKVVNGYLPVDSRPGLGLGLDHRVIDQYQANVIK
jgi:galactonate dehydratase